MGKYRILVIVLFSIFFILPKNSYAASWLSGYNYQKVFYVNGSSSGAVSNYPIKLILNKGSGTDTSSSFYLDNHALSSFNDIRFTSRDGTSLLSYWIASSDSSSATVWVKLDSVPASPSQKTFYFYYGNPAAPSLSSGADTFNFYDDFDTNGISSWTGSDQNKHSSETATQTIDPEIRASSPNSANLYTAANCSMSPFDGVGSIISRSPNLPSANYKVEFSVIREITGFGYDTTAYERSFVAINGANSFTESTSCTGINCTVAPGAWGDKSFDVTNSPITTIGLEGYADDCTQGNVWFDNVRIRNFISPEPSLSLTSNQEDSTADNNSSSTSNSSSNSNSSAPVCGDDRPASIPDLFQIDATGTTAKLFFTPVSNTSDFYISFSENADALRYGEKVNLMREGVQNETINLLKPNTIYYFMVRGQNGCMPGDWSNVMKIKTPNAQQHATSFYKYGPVTK